MDTFTFVCYVFNATQWSDHKSGKSFSSLPFSIESFIRLQNCRLECLMLQMLLTLKRLSMAVSINLLGMHFHFHPQIVMA